MKRTIGLKLPNILTDIMSSVYKDLNNFPPTQIFNEGWLLRILLECHHRGHESFPFKKMKNSNWFSEAQLSTPFKARFPGDPLSEKRTHIDGVYGQFSIRSDTKSGFMLIPDTTQFIIIEAKIFSPLSTGVKNDSNYDQAARTVACMAKTIEESRINIEDLKSAGFYVTAPQSQLDKGVFDEKIEKNSIKRKVSARIHGYTEDEDHHSKLMNWYREYFEPTLDSIKIDTLSYENMINNIQNIDQVTKERIQQYYQYCLDYNRPRIVSE